MGFNSYKIRDGKHIPSKKFKENFNRIFGLKKEEEQKDEHLEWFEDMPKKEEKE